MALNSLPLASQIISFTQQPIKDNFDGINAGFAVNHVELSALAPFTAANAGKHSWVAFTPMPIPPAAGSTPPFIAGEYGMFNQDGQLWIQSGAGVAVAIPIAGDQSSPSAPSQASGWCYLPNGLVLAWGRVAGVNNSTATPIVFNIDGGAFPDNCLSITGSFINIGASSIGGVSISFYNITAAGCDVGLQFPSAVAGRNINYLAIGW